MSTTFHIQTSGCSANQADSEQMAGLLQQAGFQIVGNLEEAYIVIINTCAVKSPSETELFRQLETFRQEYPNKLLVVAGCIAQADAPKLKQYSVVGTRQIHNIVQVVEEALHDNVLQLLSNDEMPPLDLPKVRKNPMVEILPINRGCLSACAFGKTKSARENVVSYPLSEIVAAAKKALQERVRELWLTSHDTFCYGFDLGTDLPALLGQLVLLPGEFRIRIGRGNPDHLPRIGARLIEAYRNHKVFRFLHLPLQAGSVHVLKKMKCRYTVNEFDQALNQFKAEIPGLNVMTDIIVGYPEETDDDFWQTLECVRRNSFDSVNISRFWPRPGTAAAELPGLSAETVERRTKVLTDIFTNISALQNERWLGWEGKILIDERGTEPGQWIGRNDSYKPVIVEGNFKLGEVLRVKIIKTSTYGLRGQIISEQVTSY